MPRCETCGAFPPDEDGRCPACGRQIVFSQLPSPADPTTLRPLGASLPGSVHPPAPTHELFLVRRAAGGRRTSSAGPAAERWRPTPRHPTMNPPRAASRWVLPATAVVLGAVVVAALVLLGPGADDATEVATVGEETDTSATSTTTTTPRRFAIEGSIVVEALEVRSRTSDLPDLRLPRHRQSGLHQRRGVQRRPGRDDDHRLRRQLGPHRDRRDHLRGVDRPARTAQRGRARRRRCSARPCQHHRLGVLSVPVLGPDLPAPTSTGSRWVGAASSPTRPPTWSRGTGPCSSRPGLTVAARARPGLRRSSDVRARAGRSAHRPPDQCQSMRGASP